MSITRASLFLSLVLLISVQLGCQERVPQTDIEAEKQKIAELTERWAQAESQRDVDGSLAVIAEDAVWLPPDSDVVQGIESIAALYQDFFDSVPYSSLSVEPSHISVSSSGDVAYSWATFSLGFDGPDGPTSMSFKFLATWEKRDGQWKVTSNMFNQSSQPATN